MCVLLQEHIYKLMKSDSYARFLRSNAYQDLLSMKKKVKLGWTCLHPPHITDSGLLLANSVEMRTVSLVCKFIFFARGLNVIFLPIVLT